MIELKVYPYKENVVVIEKLNKATVATAIISKREEGLSKAQAIGPVLNGSEDIATFNEVWDEIENERLDLEKIDITEYKTEPLYLSSVTDASKYIVPSTWVTKMKLKLGITKWDDIKELPEGDVLNI